MTFTHYAVAAVVLAALFLAAAIIIIGQAVGFQIDPAYFN